MLGVELNKNATGKSKDLKKLHKTLKSGIREKRINASESEIQNTVRLVGKLIEIAGYFSDSRKMRNRIGLSLLQKPIRIIAPVCPDYGHQDGKYIFGSVEGGISLLALKHIEFLQEVSSIIPGARITLIVADQEALDDDICRSVNKDSSQFRELILQTKNAIGEKVSSKGWEVDLMTSFMPALLDEETRYAREIGDDPNLMTRITSETISRTDMYLKIKSGMTECQMKERTIKTAAQYLAFGKFAEENSMIICNHTTVNLSWYLKSNAAILHNPVEVY
ncbi:MAG: hypothetical protein COV70_03115 [Parcubacteria group bacterium CG11_big_fil_rev_8_21_14_0_20_39_22]|nr:MAG: hypothetical protein COV70_03115 [Parcubacteria group bacterium CG11_big_fil_rev_8_21_14_0_20_39_22]